MSITVKYKYMKHPGTKKLKDHMMNKRIMKKIKTVMWINIWH